MVTQEPQQETREYRAPTGPYNEYILEDDECPLAILINHPPTPGECHVGGGGSCWVVFRSTQGSHRSFTGSDRTGHGATVG